MLRPHVSEKATVVTKNLGYGSKYWPCSANYFDVSFVVKQSNMIWSGWNKVASYIYITLVVVVPLGIKSKDKRCC